MSSLCANRFEMVKGAKDDHCVNLHSEMYIIVSSLYSPVLFRSFVYANANIDTKKATFGAGVMLD